MNGAEKILGVAELVRKRVGTPEHCKQGVVVSAMSKVTDALLELVATARARDDSYIKKLAALRERHLSALEALLGDDPTMANIRTLLEQDFLDIAEILRGIYLSRTADFRTAELISGYGEIWSARFLSATLSKRGVSASFVDAREVLVVESGESWVQVDWEKSQKKIDELWNRIQWHNDCVVITGFIASTADGLPATLKRNGSDFSASIFGKLLRAPQIVIWTDVDGVLSADPRLVPEAIVLDHLSYDEATELAYFGAKVVHPSTMAPAIEDRIPIWIRNTFKPEHPGTVIHTRDSIHRSASAQRGPVTGFSTVEQVALLNVEGTGMVGVPGVAERLFGALRSVGVSVILISQASSEHSICFAVPAGQAQLARTTVEKAFFAELHHGQIERVDVLPDCSILAAVGDDMVAHPGVSGRFFTALGRAGVNIRAIAQGSSERNISVVVARSEATRALRAVHAAFTLSNITLSLGLIGPGLIGGTFLKQLATESRRLKEHHGVDLRIRGILSSSRMWLCDTGIDPGNWRERFEKEAVPADILTFVRHVHAEHLPHAVILDCTSSPELPRLYPEWMKQGLHLVTPNKKGNTGGLGEYRAIRESARRHGRHYLYETTVGAGLPIIQTLRDLVQTGDQVLEIQGVLSGTLSYIFNTWDGVRPFSEAVLEAKRLGYTEPDPRDDLSGMDVARKLTILGREMGLGLELADVQVESLVADELRAGSVDEYITKLPAQDAAMKARLETARARGEVLRYVGVVEVPAGPGGVARASVSLKSFPASHAFGRLSGSDNSVSFRTRRYHAQPLVVQGPGAGPEVTAAGVFADLLKLSSYLGAVLG